MNLQKYFKETITSIRKIEEGFSVDEKYLVNNIFLVRVISFDRLERFKKVFDFQQKFYQVALCQKPLDFIIEKEFGYYITEFIPGKNGLEVIESMTLSKQRELGIIAGKELSKVHRKYTVSDFDSKAYFENYLSSKIAIAIENNVEDDLPEINDMIDIVRKNVHHLFHLQGVMAHADYHLFNMIFDQGEYKGVIDFERCRTGIFLTDFRNNTPHNSDISPSFASGFIDGYLEEHPIENFFLLYKVHDLLISIAAIPWVKQFNPENLKNDIEKIKKIYEDCRDLNKAPAWYVGKY